jgi:hypothetical protein
LLKVNAYIILLGIDNIEQANKIRGYANEKTKEN